MLKLSVTKCQVSHRAGRRGAMIDVVAQQHATKGRARNAHRYRLFTIATFLASQILI